MRTYLVEFYVESGGPRHVESVRLQARSKAAAERTARQQVSDKAGAVDALGYPVHVTHYRTVTFEL